MVLAVGPDDDRCGELRGRPRSIGPTAHRALSSTVPPDKLGALMAPIRLLVLPPAPATWPSSGQAGRSNTEVGVRSPSSPSDDDGWVVFAPGAIRIGDRFVGTGDGAKAFRMEMSDPTTLWLACRGGIAIASRPIRGVTSASGSCRRHPVFPFHRSPATGRGRGQFPTVRSPGFIARLRPARHQLSVHRGYSGRPR